MTPVRFASEARIDAVQAFDWYEARRPGLGLVFLAALDRVVERISRDPTAYAVKYRGLRRVLVERFPYVVFYRSYPEVVLVVGVVHGRRDPRVWRRRA